MHPCIFDLWLPFVDRSSEELQLPLLFVAVLHSLPFHKPPTPLIFFFPDILFTFPDSQNTLHKSHSALILTPLVYGAISRLETEPYQSRHSRLAMPRLSSQNSGGEG